ncbi:hypothetical protein BOVATA_030960 [Babesia ovata]|uniref:Uncharacterized protein n=1 Tax=Babesia ovata TaxID=189622 RepID=A0A2H6KF26_9APIC|nr:uncharacterized protein BOVATA_030960 [Babesia ovata]GBE61603.1 hypothetical protein BOVATA_030960 [Babesia ovata]
MYRTTLYLRQWVPHGHRVVVRDAEQIAAWARAPRYGVHRRRVRLQHGNQCAEELVPNVDLCVLAAVDDEALVGAAEGAPQDETVFPMTPVRLYHAALVDVPQAHDRIAPRHAQQHLVVQRAADHHGDVGVLGQRGQLAQRRNVDNVGEAIGRGADRQGSVLVDGDGANAAIDSAATRSPNSIPQFRGIR